MELERYRLGETVGTLRLQGLAELQRHSCRMASQCRRRLLIFSQRLNPNLYDQGCFVEAVRQLVIRHPATRIQVLVADTSELARGGQRLLELARDLPSSIAFRRRNEEYRGDQRSYLLADEEGYLLRNLWQDLDNVKADYSARPIVRNLAEEFQRVWERSEPDPGLRRLNI